MMLCNCTSGCETASYREMMEESSTVSGGEDKREMGF